MSHPLSVLHIPRGPAVTFQAIPFPLPEESAAVLRHLGGECRWLNGEISRHREAKADRLRSEAERNKVVAAEAALDAFLASIRSSCGVEFTRPSYCLMSAAPR